MDRGKVRSKRFESGKYFGTSPTFYTDSFRSMKSEAGENYPYSLVELIITHSLFSLKTRCLRKLRSQLMKSNLNGLQF